MTARDFGSVLRVVFQVILVAVLSVGLIRAAKFASKAYVNWLDQRDSERDALYLADLDRQNDVIDRQNDVIERQNQIISDLMASEEESSGTQVSDGGTSDLEARPAGVVLQAQTEWPEDLFLSPVSQTGVISQETSWLIAEPGVLLDNTATFDRGSSAGEHYIQCPEGGFTYISAGHGQLEIDGVTLNLEGAEGRNHIVLVRCRIDDGVQDTDLNFTIRFSGYTPGNVITSPMPRGAYVSAGWFYQQLESSAGVSEFHGLGLQSGGNCGASGCSETWLHLLDVDSGFYQKDIVEKGSIQAWAPAPVSN